MQNTSQRRRSRHHSLGARLEEAEYYQNRPLPALPVGRELEEAGEGIFVLEDFHETIARSHEITDEAIMAEARTEAVTVSKGVIGTIKSIPRILAHIDYTELLLALATIFIIYGFRKVTTKIPSTLVALFVVSGAAMAMNLSYQPIQEIVSTVPLPHLDIFSNFDLAQIGPYILSAIALALLG